MTVQCHFTMALEDSGGFTFDTVMSTFNIDIGDPAVPAAQAVLVADVLIDAFNGSFGGANSLASYYASNISRGALACTVKAYDVSGVLGGGAMGSPIASVPFTLDPMAGAATDHPHQIALVMTQKAANIGSFAVEVPDGADPGIAVDRPRQRHTGRNYLGPFNTSNTPGPRPSVTLKEAVLDFGEQLQIGLTAILAEDATWCIWSRSDAAFYPVADIHVDDRWDVQRRRGLEPLTRESRSI